MGNNDKGLQSGRCPDLRAMPSSALQLPGSLIDRAEMAGDRGVEMFEGVERWWTAAERGSRGRSSRSCRCYCESAGGARPAADAGVDLIAEREEMLVTAKSEECGDRHQSIVMLDDESRLCARYLASCRIPYRTHLCSRQSQSQTVKQLDATLAAPVHGTAVTSPVCRMQVYPKRHRHEES